MGVAWVGYVALAGILGGRLRCNTVSASHPAIRPRPSGKEPHMTRYLISFDAHAMDHITEEDFPIVGRDAHEVVREAITAGVWVFGAGIQDQVSSLVGTDGSVAGGGHPAAVGGFCVVDVSTRDEALEWAAKTAQACRCAQEVWELMDDPETEEMLRDAST
jgi:hypothetical protein